jgi:hypothetical protein
MRHFHNRKGKKITSFFNGNEGNAFFKRKTIFDFCVSSRKKKNGAKQKS